MATQTVTRPAGTTRTSAPAQAAAGTGALEKAKDKYIRTLERMVNLQAAAIDRVRAFAGQPDDFLAAARAKAKTDGSTVTAAMLALERENPARYEAWLLSERRRSRARAR